MTLHTRINVWRALGKLILIMVVAFFGSACSKNYSSADDETRVKDALKISYYLSLYKLQTHQFPQSLKEIEPTGKWKIPNDPVSQKPYDYKMIDANSYELCVVFDKANEPRGDEPRGISYGDPIVHSYGSWVHDAGRQCVRRTLTLSE